MTQTLIGSLMVIIAFIVTSGQLKSAFALTSNSTPQQTTTHQVVMTNQPIITESRFESEITIEDISIPKETVYKDDPEVEAGEETVVSEGRDGKTVKHIEITYYEGEVYDKKVIKTEKVPVEDKIITRGTKIIWKSLATSEGDIKYWKKMRVYATHYDSRCNGCDDWTAIGMRAGKGVIAVDPKVIKLRSKVYIPGYGVAVAGDTGGAIKGNIIDLGFEDAKTAPWSARYIDIYLL